MLPLKAGKIYVAHTIGDEWIYGMIYNSHSSTQKNHGIFPKINVKLRKEENIFNEGYNELDSEAIGLLEGKHIISQTVKYIEKTMLVI